MINDRSHGILMTGGDDYFWIINSWFPITSHDIELYLFR